MNESQNYEQPMVVRYSNIASEGVQPQNLTRHAIGCVLSGEKYIYDADRSLHVQRGEIFFLGKGWHHIENVSERNHPYEQVIFYFSSEDLQRIISSFSMTYNIDITNNHLCEACRRSNAITCEAWSQIATFFENLNKYLRDDEFIHDEAAESIKMTELVYLILSHKHSCLRSKLLRSIDSEKSSFEQIVYSNIFKDVGIEELADLSHRSLTAFKKEFKRIFDYPPHQWFLRQRLNHSKLLLLSTRKSVAEIGTECAFPNISHFIKLFKKSYGDTPATYRNKHTQIDMHEEIAENLLVQAN